MPEILQGNPNTSKDTFGRSSKNDVERICRLEIAVDRWDTTPHYIFLHEEKYQASSRTVRSCCTPWAWISSCESRNVPSGAPLRGAFSSVVPLHPSRTNTGSFAADTLPASAVRTVEEKKISCRIHTRAELKLEPRLQKSDPESSNVDITDK